MGVDPRVSISKTQAIVSVLTSAVCRTPKFRPALDDAPLISVYAQERQECLMIPADGSSTEVKANIVQAGVDLMTRLLGPEDNDWRVQRHSLGPVHQAAADAPAVPNFDSVLEMAHVPKASPPLQIVKESTIVGRPGRNAAPQALEEPKVIVWDDSDVIKGPGENDVLNHQHVLYPEDQNNPKPTPKVLIYQMHAPLWFGTLWDKVLANIERTDLSIVIVIDADDLRADGVRISRGISWEKTMEDFKERMERIDKKITERIQGGDEEKERVLGIVKKKVHLLVRCGYEGVLHQRPQRSTTSPPFVFHMVPDMAEDDILKPYHGRMSGIHMAFVTGLAASLARDPSLSPDGMGRTQIGAAIELAIIWSYRFASAGFAKDSSGALSFPRAKHINNYQTSKIKIIHGDKKMIFADGMWSLFNLLSTEQESLAAQVVKLGTKRIQASVPTAQYGVVKTADRIEIEGYRSTAAVIHEYLSGKPPRPLSIAVFGQPGAGKSFGVKQVIKAVLKDWGKDCKPIEANLSQFLEYSDLVGVFHKVRDTALRDEIPVVLFDEFDSHFGGKPLGWLKYFLAPMQDGEFLDSGSVRPLGRAIFIFIGGTSSTFNEFRSHPVEQNLGEQSPLPQQNLPAKEKPSAERKPPAAQKIPAEEKPPAEKNPLAKQNTPEAQTLPEQNPPAAQNTPAGHVASGGQNNPLARRDPTPEEKQAKKPDFVSRLSAHIDVRGPNPNRDGNDNMCTMRRAILLQGLLERRFGAEVKDIKVDDTVLKALLMHEGFPHGSRSLELILQMSRLSGLRRYESSALPSDDQLGMHVGDVSAFIELINGAPINMAKVRPIDVSLNNKWMWARMKDVTVED